MARPKVSENPKEGITSGCGEICMELPQLLILFASLVQAKMNDLTFKHMQNLMRPAWTGFWPFDVISIIQNLFYFLPASVLSA